MILGESAEAVILCFADLCCFEDDRVVLVILWVDGRQLELVLLDVLVQDLKTALVQALSQMREVRLGGILRILAHEIIALIEISIILGLEVLARQVANHFELDQRVLDVHGRVSVAAHVDQGFGLEDGRHLVSILVTTRRLLLFGGISRFGVITLFSKFGVEVDAQFFGVVLLATGADLALSASHGSLGNVRMFFVRLLYLRHSLGVRYPLIPADPSLLMMHVLVGAELLDGRQSLFLIQELRLFERRQRRPLDVVQRSSLNCCNRI